LNRDQALRECIGDGPQAHAMTARQQECLHQLPLATIRTFTFSVAPDGQECPASLRKGVGGMR
jgi:hypothetical protein